MFIAPNSADQSHEIRFLIITFLYRELLARPFFLMHISPFMGCIFSQMEVECLALKDLSSPRKSFTMDPEDEEDGRQSEHKVRWPCVRCLMHLGVPGLT